MSESLLNPSASGSTISVRRSTHSPLITLVGASVVVVVLTIAPWIFPAQFASTLMNFFILVIMATMWNLLAGYAGMVSIGQQAFVGLGAYATLYFALKGMNPFLTIPFAALVCAVLAVPVTYLLFRLRGGYFAIATWVVADTVMLIIGTIAFLGGGTGRLMPGLQSLTPAQTAHYSYHIGQIVLLAKHFASDQWQSLSVPRNRSAEFNRKVAAGEASQR